MTVTPTSNEGAGSAAADARRPPGFLARRRVRPVAARLVVLACLLVIGGLGYFVIYPQVNAVYHWRHARKALDAYEFAQARADLQRCLEVWPESGETHFLMARTCRRDGDMEQARAELQQAKRLHWVEEQIRLEYLLQEAQGGAVPQVERAL
ncbi:MAG TPA: tetratricopeptide repeat protein, partial [Gemmataceae bacterium]|nr:tetratricopeptide repeat protein [Gemmataceae bacterium]